MNGNTAEHQTGEVRRHPQPGSPTLTWEQAQVTATPQNSPSYAPLHKAVPGETFGYEWKRETGDIQSYRHNVTTGWLHIDPQGQFHNRQGAPISRNAAFESAGHSAVHALGASFSNTRG